MKIELVSSTLIPLLFAFYFMLLLDTLYLFTFTWNNKQTNEQQQRQQQQRRQQQQQQQQHIFAHIECLCT